MFQLLSIFVYIPLCVIGQLLPDPIPTLPPQNETARVDNAFQDETEIANCTLANQPIPCNPGCNCNAFCSNLLITQLPLFVQLLKSENFTFSRSKQDTPIEEFNITVTDNFNVILTKNVCSNFYTNGSIRRDWLQFQLDNIEADIKLNLLEMAQDTASALWIFDAVDEATENNDYCLKEGTNAVTDPILITQIAENVTQCLNANNLTDSVDSTGTFSVKISHYEFILDFDAIKYANWSANFAGQVNKNEVQFSDFVCNGTSTFNKACSCIFNPDLMKTFLFLEDAKNTCRFNYLINLNEFSIVRCGKYIDVPQDRC